MNIDDRPTSLKELQRAGLPTQFIFSSLRAYMS